LTADWARGYRHRPPAKLYPPPQLRKRRGCEQVAAVCYRVRSRGIEFLLVHTRKGRWTFPKGGLELGLTDAQAAALEAFEEAGVHGRIEQMSFARYICHKHGDTRDSAVEITINAHLCQVLQLDPPQEANRNPTWFSAEKTKRHLREGRNQEDADELARVVDHAVTRIQRLRNASNVEPDALQKVQFEVGEEAKGYDHMGASFLRYIRQRDAMRHSAAVEPAVNSYLGEILRLLPSRELNGKPSPEKGEQHPLHNSASICALPSAQTVEIDSAEGMIARAKASSNGRRKGKFPHMEEVK
jgi:8-oxo-dGTP pyrophosphatase MutT (NUDIX family)